MRRSVPKPEQGASTKNAVGFAGEAGDAAVVFAADAFGVDVGQSGAGHAGLEVGKAFFGDVEGVYSAFVCHLCADGEGFAACAGAEIDDDFAAFGTDKQGEELAAFVLDFKRAV